MSDGPTISGGGSIRVETDGMLRAAALLATARDALGTAITQAGGCIADCPPGPRRLRLEEARAHLADAQVQSERAADGLRTAAWRYGAAEHTAFLAQRAVWAESAAVVGALARVVGPVPVAVGLLDAAALAIAIRTAERWIETGDAQPQLDPVVLDALGLALVSIDDAVRGALLAETPHDLLTNDPDAAIGTEHVAALFATLFTRTPGSPIAVAPTTSRRVSKPEDLAALADRLPDGAQPAGQVRIERYDDADGTRWIVYIAGTVTFAPDGGEQPFDSSSNLFGVADLPTDAETSVLTAMREAGVGADEPVLLVGHSQGALTAARVAEHGGYRVQGLVELGGPTGSIRQPTDVPVLTVRHDEDPVPRLGGVGTEGVDDLRPLVVERSVPHGGAARGVPPFAGGFPSHAPGLYASTLRQAEASGDDRVARYRAEIGAFLGGGDGTATRYRAVRVSPGPSPRAVAGSVR